MVYISRLIVDVFRFPIINAAPFESHGSNLAFPVLETGRILILAHGDLRIPWVSWEVVYLVILVGHRATHLCRDVVRSYLLVRGKVPFWLEEVPSILTVLRNNADAFPSCRARLSFLKLNTLPRLTSPLSIRISLAFDFVRSVNALLVAGSMHSFIPVTLGKRLSGVDWPILVVSNFEGFRELYFRVNCLLRNLIHVLCWWIQLGLLHLHCLLSSLVDDDEVARHLHLDLLDLILDHAPPLPDWTSCIASLTDKSPALIVDKVLWVCKVLIHRCFLAYWAVSVMNLALPLWRLLV